MKRTLLTAVLLACTCVILFLTGCQPAASNVNHASENANVAKEKPVDAAAIEKELLQLERDWATAPVSRNVDAVKRIEADDISVTYPDGTTGTKADDIKDIETGALTAERWDLQDVKVKVLNADAAVVTGRGFIKNGKYKGPDGRIQMLKPDYRFTDLFARRNGQWQVVASQATWILNPIPVPSPTAQPSASPSASRTISPSPPAK